MWLWLIAIMLALVSLVISMRIASYAKQTERLLQEFNEAIRRVDEQQSRAADTPKATEAICSWGEGADDVLVVVAKRNARGEPWRTYGANDSAAGSFYLSSDEARKLAAQLNTAADAADELSNGYAAAGSSGGPDEPA